MDQFERQFENLDVQSEFVENAMGNQATLSTPEEDVNLLLQQVRALGACNDQVISGPAVAQLTGCLGFYCGEWLGLRILGRIGFPAYSFIMRIQGQHLRVADVFATHRVAPVSLSVLSSLVHW